MNNQVAVQQKLVNMYLNIVENLIVMGTEPLEAIKKAREVLDQAVKQSEWIDAQL
jgi:hypothetical protein